MQVFNALIRHGNDENSEKDSILSSRHDVSSQKHKIQLFQSQSLLPVDRRSNILSHAQALSAARHTSNSLHACSIPCTHAMGTYPRLCTFRRFF